MLDERLIELESFLKKKYSDEICQHFINAFLLMREFYPEQKLKKDNYDLLERKYIELIKNSEIIFVDDINKDKYLKDKVKDINPSIKVKGGYVETAGKLVVDIENPKKVPTISGHAKYDQKKVIILYDELAKFNQSISYFEYMIIHELTHLTQSGFEIPWFITAREHFIKTLREGHAMKIGGYVYEEINVSRSIPFNYDDKNNIYNKKEINGNLNYAIYNYLYYKLEILLGNDFMEKWATTANDESFIIKSKKIMDSKYGESFSSEFYKYFQVILLDVDKLNKDQYNQIKNSQQKGLSSYKKNKNSNLKILVDNFQIILRNLDDKVLFQTTYEKERKRQEEFNKDNDDFFSSTKYTYEKHRDKLNKDIFSENNQIYLYKNPKEVEEIYNSSISACEEIINNSNYLTSALVNLESLIIDSLLKDIKNNEPNSIEKVKNYFIRIDLMQYENNAMKPNHPKVIELYDILKHNKNNGLKK